MNPILRIRRWFVARNLRLALQYRVDLAGFPEYRVSARFDKRGNLLLAVEGVTDESTAAIFEIIAPYVSITEINPTPGS